MDARRRRAARGECTSRIREALSIVFSYTFRGGFVVAHHLLSRFSHRYTLRGGTLSSAVMWHSRLLVMGLSILAATVLSARSAWAQCAPPVPNDSDGDCVSNVGARADNCPNIP